MSQTLHPMRFPLYGERLIEASAGTGKTFTIATLYLRLLLGHGPESTAHDRPLEVPEILVVTFTEAATEELRDRIRRRIHAARQAFDAGSSDDDLLAQLLAECGDHPTQSRLLLAAERQMDQAAIFTIHGFCQRMLKQNAFESGSLFETTFLTDDSELRQQAVADFWRSQFYPLASDLVRQVRPLWPDPAALLADLGPHLGNSELRLLTAQPPQDLGRLHNQFLAEIDAMKQQWLAGRHAIAEEVEGQVARYTGKTLANWLSKIDAWADSPTDNYDSPKELAKFALGEMAGKLKKNAKTPSHGLFSGIEAFCLQSRTLRDVILAQALTEVRQRMQAHKQRHQLLAFDDLLANLDRALAQDRAGHLAGRIREQFRVAMIDEFQDTDPQQYRIFHGLYGGRSDSGLFMIGDPKQAIYGFRGADIFTYIQARRNVSAHYTLGKNWRSTQAMVTASNALFERAEAPFIYQADIPFHPVDAQGKDKGLRLDDQALPALTLWHQTGDDKPVVNQKQYQQVMARATASQINALLTAGNQGRARLGDKPLRAGDIAILVRTGREAQLIRQALGSQGIPCVYLSNRDSVFSSQEADDLHRILAACLAPNNERLLRGALATPLLALSAQQLAHLNQDEEAWEAAVGEFRDYNLLWRRQGVLPMVRRLLHQRELAARLQASPLGERRLTDLLHLGELLQQASAELDGQHSLLRWLGEHLFAPNGNAEEQQVRLESDSNLVQIVTIHKSKGLEYPLVFLPFICGFRPADNALYHDQDYRAVLDLTANEDALAEADKERLAEDLRLLYVAITRAVYGTWLGMAPLARGNRGKSAKTDLHLSAIGYLLQGAQAGDADTLANALASLARDCPEAVVLPPPDVPAKPWQAPLQDEQVLAARQFTQPLERNWWITSYSALSRHHGSRDASAELRRFDRELVDEQLLATPSTPERTIFTFPRGARPGTFLHSLFEQLDFPTARGPGLETTIVEMLRAEDFEPEWQPVLEQLVVDVLDAELAPGLTLRQLEKHQKKVEMEFMLPLQPVSADALNRVIKQHDPHSAAADHLGFETVRGMLKGFIDLTFVHQGRFYVLDYKSNHLGDSPAKYQETALVDAMIEHRYDLQYQLYTLALHRLLRSRIPDYDYDRHVGGVFYLFLRGMRADQGANSGVFHTRPSSALIEALDRLFDGEVSHDAA